MEADIAPTTISDMNSNPTSTGLRCFGPHKEAKVPGMIMIMITGTSHGRTPVSMARSGPLPGATITTATME